MPTKQSDASALASLLDGSTAGQLRPPAADRAGGIGAVGADRHECSEERTNFRNGYRPRRLTTECHVPEICAQRRWSFSRIESAVAVQLNGVLVLL